MHLSKKIGIILTKPSRFNKPLLEESSILSNQGYKVFFIPYPSPFRPFKKPLPVNFPHPVLKLSSLITQRFDFYHSHNLLGMCLSLIASVLHRGHWVRDYQELLVPPIYDHKEELLKKDPLALYYYDQDNFWEREIQEKEKDRIEKTLSMIPNDVITILDVGCGSGYITNRLKNKYQAVGLDISQNALQKVETARVLGSASFLPFQKGSFDLVICAELIEHLPLKMYLKTLEEVKKVTKKYIIISVPYKEILQVGTSFCYNCHRTFQAGYHMRSFNLNRLKKLSGSFKYQKSIYCGTMRDYYNQVLLFIKHYLVGVWTRTPLGICLYCGCPQRKQGKPEKNVLTWFCDRTNEEIRNMIKDRGSSHIAVLYQKGS